METFAPAYFDYMSSSFTAGVCLLLIALLSAPPAHALFNQRPTLLAKIFGCFKVTWRTTSHSGPGKPKSNQMNLVVMENLFYDRRFSKVSQRLCLHIGNICLKHDRACFLGKIYDLKGSTRNRHVQSTGRENEVLLDENLNESEPLVGIPNASLKFTRSPTVAHLSPFFLREHSKRILRGALNSDSKFLADINVMDYSFVVGIDSVKNELVVGIVGESLHGRSVIFFTGKVME